MPCHRVDVVFDLDAGVLFPPPGAVAAGAREQLEVGVLLQLRATRSVASVWALARALRTVRWKLSFLSTFIPMMVNFSKAVSELKSAGHLSIGQRVISMVMNVGTGGAVKSSRYERYRHVKLTRRTHGLRSVETALLQILAALRREHPDVLCGPGRPS